MARVCICCKYRAANIVSDISLFGFPTNNELLKQWLLTIGTQKKFSKSWRICSRHFKEEDFRYSLVGGKRMLKRGVIPSLHLNGKTKDDLLSNNQSAIAVEKQSVNTEDECITKTIESIPLNIAESHIENMSEDILSHAIEIEVKTTIENTCENIQFTSHEPFSEPQIPRRISSSSPSPDKPGKRHKKCLYDVRWDEISTSPVQAKIYWEVAIKKIKQQKAFLRVLRQKVKRLKKTIIDLQTRVNNVANTDTQ